MRCCSFCGRRGPQLVAGRLALCAACRDALCAVSPADPRYAWFVSAVRRAPAVPAARAAAPLRALEADRNF